MRSSVAVIMAVTVLFVGVYGISISAQQAKPAINSPTGNSTYNMSVDFFTGMGQAGSGAVVYGGIGAVVLIALGLLVAAGGRGR